MTKQVPPVGDGEYTLRNSAGYKFVGRYQNGLREGLWQVFGADGHLAWETTWHAGQWHGRSTDYWRNGSKKSEGDHANGEVTGDWTFWFENGQLAARGQYEHDRKVGAWLYWNENGAPMEPSEWASAYEEFDWAWDDYSRAPRGDRWPTPTPG